MKKIAILGYGARGHIYANYISENQDKYIVTDIADIDSERKRKALKEFQHSRIHESAEAFFETKRDVDAVCICTQDKDHFNHSKMAIDYGYDILLEKPISNKLLDCIELEKIAKDSSSKIIICHVLRYTKFYQEIKRVIESQEIGKIINIEHTEAVGYWHYAHSFCRGNWNNSNTSAPMILTKCCHDTDVVMWLMGDECSKVSSFGSLSFFKAENAPERSGERCTDCEIAEDCCYNAYNFYIHNKDWMPLIFTENATDTEIFEQLKTLPYGRCVFKCDNNVVDNQVVNLEFKNGATASITMIAFSEQCNRTTRVYGSYGEIIGDFENRTVIVNIFGKKSYTIDINNLTQDFSNHGGGDNRLMDDFYKILMNKQNDCIAATGMETSVASHKIAFASECSRLNNGNSVEISKMLLEE